MNDMCNRKKTLRNLTAKLLTTSNTVTYRRTTQPINYQARPNETPHSKAAMSIMNVHVCMNQSIINQIWFPPLTQSISRTLSLNPLKIWIWARDVSTFMVWCGFSLGDLITPFQSLSLLIDKDKTVQFPRIFKRSHAEIFNQKFITSLHAWRTKALFQYVISLKVLIKLHKTFFKHGSSLRCSFYKGINIFVTHFHHKSRLGQE